MKIVVIQFTLSLITGFGCLGQFNADPFEKWKIFGQMNQTILNSGNASNGLTPAELIYYSAKENNINPIFLISKLQDEQSLIKHFYNDSLLEQRLNKAAGYGCRISATDCNGYLGFYPQIVSCTWQFNQFQKQGKNFHDAYTTYTPYEIAFQNFVQNIYPSFAEAMNNISGMAFSLQPSSCGYFDDFKNATINQIQQLLDLYDGRLKEQNLFGFNLYAINRPLLLEPGNEKGNSTILNSPTVKFSWNSPIEAVSRIQVVESNETSNPFPFNEIDGFTSGAIFVCNENTGLNNTKELVLEHAKYYSWSVRYYNAKNGTSKYSQPNYFEVNLKTPILLEPCNNVIEGDSVLFKWNEIDKANQYRIQISANAEFDDINGFASPLFNANIGNNWKYSTITTTGNYYWTIRAGNENMGSLYSKPCTFTTRKKANNNVYFKGKGETKIYPLPIKDMLVVKLNNANNANIELFNLQGALLRTSNVLKGQTVVFMSIQNINAGAYILKIISANGIENRTIIKQ